MPELDLLHIFTHHPPGGDDAERYQRLRDAALTFAEAVLRETPSCADQTAAIRHIREAVMTANAAIALKGRLYKGPGNTVPGAPPNIGRI